MKIITENSDAALFKDLSGRLSKRGTLIKGGMGEWSGGPGNSGSAACVYWLCCSDDQTLYGLSVDRYEPMPDLEEIMEQQREAAESENEDTESDEDSEDEEDDEGDEDADSSEEELEDIDPYCWSLDNLQCDTEIGAIAILDAGESVDEEMIARQLTKTYLKNGGFRITQPCCP